MVPGASSLWSQGQNSLSQISNVAAVPLPSSGQATEQAQASLAWFPYSSKNTWPCLGPCLKHHTIKILYLFLMWLFLLPCQCLPSIPCSSTAGLHKLEQEA